MKEKNPLFYKQNTKLSHFYVTLRFHRKIFCASNQLGVNLLRMTTLKLKQYRKGRSPNGRIILKEQTNNIKVCLLAGKGRPRSP